MDIHDLYENCVQSPEHVGPMLRAIHGGRPTILAEDFAGTGALCRHWCATVPGGRAIAVDLDAAVLARAAAQPGVETVVGDVRTASDPARHAGDIVFAGMNVILGGVIALFMILEPKGLMHRWNILKSSYRIWPFPY